MIGVRLSVHDTLCTFYCASTTPACVFLIACPFKWLARRTLWTNSDYALHVGNIATDGLLLCSNQQYAPSEATVSQSLLQHWLCASFAEISIAHRRHKTVRDNYNLKSHKYVCITTYQPDTKSNPNPNLNTKQHAIVNIQLNIIISSCPAYPEKFIRLCDFRL